VLKVAKSCFSPLPLQESKVAKVSFSAAARVESVESGESVVSGESCFPPLLLNFTTPHAALHSFLISLLDSQHLFLQKQSCCQHRPCTRMLLSIHLFISTETHFDESPNITDLSH